VRRDGDSGSNVLEVGEAGQPGRHPEHRNGAAPRGEQAQLFVVVDDDEPVGEPPATRLTGPVDVRVLVVLLQCLVEGHHLGFRRVDAERGDDLAGIVALEERQQERNGVDLVDPPPPRFGGRHAGGRYAAPADDPGHAHPG
jgi:hypothetical protein